jgi:hypothetical protein
MIFGRLTPAENTSPQRRRVTSVAAASLEVLASVTNVNRITLLIIRESSLACFSGGILFCADVSRRKNILCYPRPSVACLFPFATQPHTLLEG